MLSVRILFLLLVLYVVALPTSIAAMEIVSWSIFLLFLSDEVNAKFDKRERKSLKIGADWTYWGFWLTLCAGALLIDTLSSERVIYIIGEGRWILLLYAFSLVLSRHWEWVKKLMFLFLVVGFILSIYAIYQSFTGIDLIRGNHGYNPLPEGAFWRAKGFFSSTMTYSYSLGMLFSFFVAGLFLNVDESRSGRLFRMLVVFTLGSSLVLTFTRGLWFGLTVSIVTIAFLKGRKFGVLTVSLLLVPLVIAFVSTPLVSNRFYGVFAPEKVVIQTEKTLDRSRSHRFDLWRANWAMFKDHPLLGVGHRQNQSRVQEYHLKANGRKAFDGHAHNNFLQVLAGTGLLGLFFYLSFMGFIFWTACRLWRKLPREALWERSIALGSIGAQLCFHLGGLTESNFYDGEVNHMFVFLSALILALAIHSKKWTQSLE